jgi:hypothetical protein
MKIPCKLFIRSAHAAAVLLLIVALHSCSKNERSEKEPNNFFAEANEIDIWTKAASSI